jgi:hypothetical protein
MVMGSTEQSRRDGHVEEATSSRTQPPKDAVRFRILGPRRHPTRVGHRGTTKIVRIEAYHSLTSVHPFSCLDVGVMVGRAVRLMPTQEPPRYFKMCSGWRRQHPYQRCPRDPGAVTLVTVAAQSHEQWHIWTDPTVTRRTPVPMWPPPRRTIKARVHIALAGSYRVWVAGATYYRIKWSPLSTPACVGSVELRVDGEGLIAPISLSDAAQGVLLPSKAPPLLMCLPAQLPSSATRAPATAATTAVEPEAPRVVTPQPTADLPVRGDEDQDNEPDDQDCNQHDNVRVGPGQSPLTEIDCLQWSGGTDLKRLEGVFRRCATGDEMMCV